MRWSPVLAVVGQGRSYYKGQLGVLQYGLPAAHAFGQSWQGVAYDSPLFKLHKLQYLAPWAKLRLPHKMTQRLLEPGLSDNTNNGTQWLLPKLRPLALLRQQQRYGESYA